MTIRHESWPPGRPAWADLMTPDRHAAREFYGGLFGWDFAEGAPETGYYTMALKNGEPVVGIGEPLPGQEAETPFQWTTYLATYDVDATVAVAQTNGATILAPPMDVMEFGRMAVFADPTGAVVGLWQAGTHTGSNVVDEPGSIVWTEQMSRDLDAAKAFFAAVFGYTYTDMSAEGFRYVTFEIDGEMVGGLGEISADMGDVPPNWLTYFGVEDADSAVEYVSSHGGQVARPPWDTEYGRITILQGPAGETFGAIASPPQA